MPAGGVNIQGRRRARRLCLQALYQWQMNEQPANELIAEHLAEADPARVDVDYFSHLTRGVLRELPDIDEQVAPYLDREATKLTPIERAVLRLATFELKHQVDVPYRVVISEAIELTRQFGATDAHKFVNGVLDKVAMQLRSIEREAARPAT